MLWFSCIYADNNLLTKVPGRLQWRATGTKGAVSPTAAELSKTAQTISSCTHGKTKSLISKDMSSLTIEHLDHSTSSHSLALAKKKSWRQNSVTERIVWQIDIIFKNTLNNLISRAGEPIFKCSKGY